MDQNQNSILGKDITKVLGLDELSDEEKLIFLNEIGDTILQSALLRLVTDLSTDQQAALDQFLETEPEAEALLKHLFEHHKNFEQILTEEIASFKEEAVAVLGEVE